MTRFDHVGVFVDDLQEAKRFLEDVLGIELNREFEVNDLGVTVAFFRAGDTDIELIELDDASARRRKLGAGVSAKLDHIAFEVSDLKDVVDRFAQEGVLLRGRPGRYAADPDPVYVDGRLSLWADAEKSGGIGYQFLQPPQS